MRILKFIMHSTFYNESKITSYEKSKLGKNCFLRDLGRLYMGAKSLSLVFYPSYGPDLASFDFDLFGHIKDSLHCFKLRITIPK